MANSVFYVILGQLTKAQRPLRTERMRVMLKTNPRTFYPRACDFRAKLQEITNFLQKGLPSHTLGTLCFVVCTIFSSLVTLEVWAFVRG